MGRYLSILVFVLAFSNSAYAEVYKESKITEVCGTYVLARMAGDNLRPTLYVTIQERSNAQPSPIFYPMDLLPNAPLDEEGLIGVLNENTNYCVTGFLQVTEKQEVQIVVLDYEQKQFTRN